MKFSSGLMDQLGLNVGLATTPLTVKCSGAPLIGTSHELGLIVGSIARTIAWFLSSVPTQGNTIGPILSASDARHAN